MTESEEIVVYFSVFYFILFYDTCSDMTGEHDTRNNNQIEGSSQHCPLVRPKCEEKRQRKLCM
jgi:hypothetical protein